MELSNELKKPFKSSVMIYSMSYDKSQNKHEQIIYQGSGIIFYRNELNHYYVLTNHHVIAKDYTFNKVAYKIEDFAGETYNARLEYTDAEYDLAILSFKQKESKTLPIMKLEERNPNLGDEAIAIGSPSGNKNVISKGIVVDYQQIVLPTAEVQVKFPVIKHTAPISPGSSGGVLLNTNNKIIGLNYAGSNSYGCAIPVERIKEYLDLTLFKKVEEQKEPPKKVDVIDLLFLNSIK